MDIYYQINEDGGKLAERLPYGICDSLGISIKNPDGTSITPYEAWKLIEDKTGASCDKYMEMYKRTGGNRHALDEMNSRMRKGKVTDKDFDELTSKYKPKKPEPKPKPKKPEPKKQEPEKQKEPEKQEQKEPEKEQQKPEEKKAEPQKQEEEKQEKKELSDNEKRAYDTLKLRASYRNIETIEPGKLSNGLTSDEAIDKLSAEDPYGSCSSLALAYIGNRLGYDVLDMRNEETCEMFSERGNVENVVRTFGGEINKDGRLMQKYWDGLTNEDKSDLGLARKSLKRVQEGTDGKEYYFVCGGHAAIVRKNGDSIDFLNLQTNNFGWHKLTQERMINRFGCRSRMSKRAAQSSMIVPMENFSEREETFASVLGFLNSKKKQ